jgi:hypothetical protein
MRAVASCFRNAANLVFYWRIRNRSIKSGHRRATLAVVANHAASNQTIIAVRLYMMLRNACDALTVSISQDHAALKDDDQPSATSPAN